MDSFHIQDIRLYMRRKIHGYLLLFLLLITQETRVSEVSSLLKHQLEQRVKKI